MVYDFQPNLPDCRWRVWTLSDSEFVGRLQRRTTAAADHGRAVAAGQWIVDFLRAVRTIQPARMWVRCRIRWPRRHEEGTVAQVVQPICFAPSAPCPPWL